MEYKVHENYRNKMKNVHGHLSTVSVLKVLM